MKKRIISLILVITTLFSVCAVTANAAREETFISEVALVYEDSVEDAKAAIAGTDWQLLEYDLNAKADEVFQDGVFLIYKTTNNVDDAITDLRVMDMYGGYSAVNYDKQLEASRENYLSIIKSIRIAAAEFKTLYEAGDEMAALAYRQMNYYIDEGETDLLMGEFFLGNPSDEQYVTMMMESNSTILTNLLSLLAIGVSGAGDKSLSDRAAEQYADKANLEAEAYHESAKALTKQFEEFCVIFAQYESRKDEFDINDEEVTEEEYNFMIECAAIATLFENFEYAGTNLKDFVSDGAWREDETELYPLLAAMTEGQVALFELGFLNVVLQYASPSKSIEELTAMLDEGEKDFTDENGNVKTFSVYLGVDRSIFEGDFAYTTAADRQQAITGHEAKFDEAASEAMPAIALVSTFAAGLALMATEAVCKFLFIKVATSLQAFVLEHGFMTAFNAIGKVILITKRLFLTKFATVSNGVTTSWYIGNITYGLGAGLIAIAIAGVMFHDVYGYYNPNYLPVPNAMVDVRETDAGDKYIKYTAAKVLEDGRLTEKNADFNAYAGKEWNALYYTKDSNAGNCLLANFSFSDSNNTVARRYQGVSMFGETKAFNLNSHVYNHSAKGSYLTIRYSTTQKSDVEGIPTVVGSMFANGVLYTLTAIGGAAVGAGATFGIISYKKKKNETPAEASAEA